MTNDRRSYDKIVTDVQLATAVSNAVEMHRILLKSAAVSSSFDPENPPTEFVPRQGFRASPPAREGDRLRVLVGFKLELGPAPSAETPPAAVTIEATYEVIYRIPSGQEQTFEERELKYFADLAATHHVWPYWRELVQSVTNRVGLGSVTLPFFRVRPTVVEKKEQQKPEG